MINPNGDNYIFFAFECIPYETKDDVNRETFSVNCVNFYPMFEDLLEEALA